MLTRIHGRQTEYGRRTPRLRLWVSGPVSEGGVSERRLGVLGGTEERENGSVELKGNSRTGQS